MTRTGALLVFLAMIVAVLGVFGGFGVVEVVVLFVLLAAGVSFLIVGLSRQFKRRHGTRT
jgi:hypothetical protein